MPSPRKVSPSPSVSACTSFLKERSIASTWRDGGYIYIGAGANATGERRRGRPAATTPRNYLTVMFASRMTRLYVDLPPQVVAEFGAAHPDRKEPLLGELGFHVGGLERGAEPAG